MRQHTKHSWSTKGPLKFVLRACLLLAVAGLAASCDAVEEDLVEAPVYRITGVSVTPMERRQEGTQTIHYYTDTLTTQLKFEVVTEVEVVRVNYVERPVCDDVNDCVPLGAVENPTAREHRWIRFDTPIQYKGRRIKAGANLLDDEELVAAFDGFHLDLAFPSQIGPWAIQSVRLRPEAFEIADGFYEIAFGWGTAAGNVFSDTVRVYIALAGDAGAP